MRILLLIPQDVQTSGRQLRNLGVRPGRMGWPKLRCAEYGCQADLEDRLPVFRDEVLIFCVYP